MSILEHPDQVVSAPMWRCPRCSTIQAQATRCWRCSTPVHTCETCRHYRPSVAAGLGDCADAAAGTLVSADESRSCWQTAATPSPTMVSDSSRGLFAEVEPDPLTTVHEEPAPRPAPELRAAPDRVLRAATEWPPRPPKPPLEEPGRAAWVEPDEDRLVDAPAVTPGRDLATEVQRRRRRWFR